MHLHFVDLFNGCKNMKNIIWVLFFVFVDRGYGFCDSSNQEPCRFKNNRELPYPVYTRHPSIDYSSSTDATKYCDLFALNHGQWYRSSYNMTNYCVDHRKCGTNDPIYLNGSIPSPADGVVNATACVRTFGSCCENTLSIRIKHCVYFMVYCFMDLQSSCHSRFCFDVDLDVETTTTTSTTTTTTTTTTTPTTTTTTAATATNPVPTTKSSESPPGDKQYKGGDKGPVIVLATLFALSMMAIVFMGVVIYFLRSQKVSDGCQIITGSAKNAREEMPVYIYDKKDIQLYDKNIPPKEHSIPY